MDDQQFAQTASLSKDFIDKVAENIRGQIDELAAENESFVGIVESCDELISDYSKTSRRL